MSEPICLRDRCRLCLKACYMDCIKLRTDAAIRDHRSVEADDHGRIFIDTPSRTFPAVCRRRREGRPTSPIRGDCARVGPIPRPRPDLPEHLKRLVAAWQEGQA